MLQTLSPQALEVVDKIAEMMGYEQEASVLDADEHVEKREVQGAQNQANAVVNALKGEGVLLDFDGEKIAVTRDGHSWLFYDGQDWTEHEK